MFPPTCKGVVSETSRFPHWFQQIPRLEVWKSLGGMWPIVRNLRFCLNFLERCPKNPWFYWRNEFVTWKPEKLNSRGFWTPWNKKNSWFFRVKLFGMKQAHLQFRFQGVEVQVCVMLDAPGVTPPGAWGGRLTTRCCRGHWSSHFGWEWNLILNQDPSSKRGAKTLRGLRKNGLPFSYIYLGTAWRGIFHLWLMRMFLGWCYTMTPVLGSINSNKRVVFA